MKKCIYCLQDETKTPFTSREHVIPQSLGTFSGKTLLFDKEIVCHNCNNFLSKLETKFKEDSIEGYYTNLWLKPRTSTSVRIFGKRFQLTASAETMSDLGIFKEMMPFMTLENGKVTPRAVIGLKNSNGIYQGFLVSKLEEVSRNKTTAKYRKLKSELDRLDKKDMIVISDMNWDQEQVISILKEYDIQYTPKVIEKAEDKKIGNYIQFNFQGIIDNDIKRLIAKVGFNYFAYCAKVQGNVDMLFQDRFTPLRDFINGKTEGYNFRIKEGPLMNNGQVDSVKLNRFHTLRFNKDGNIILARVCFWGLLVYEFPLAKYTGVIYPNFGCETVFDPINESILEKNVISGDIMIINRSPYGLYNL